MMIFHSLEPWSIIFTLTLAWASAENDDFETAIRAIYDIFVITEL